MLGDGKRAETFKNESAFKRQDWFSKSYDKFSGIIMLYVKELNCELSPSQNKKLQNSACFIIIKINNFVISSYFGSFRL